MFPIIAHFMLSDTVWWSLLNCVLYVFTCQRALCAHVLTCLACLHTNVSYVTTCLACLRAHVATYLACLRANVLCEYLWRAPHRASHWHSCELMFCNNSQNITPIWCSTKIYRKVEFNDIHNKQRIFKVNNKSTKKYYKDLHKVNRNLKTTWQTLLWYPCYEIWKGPTPNAMLLVYTLNRHLCAELTFN